MSVERDDKAEVLIRAMSRYADGDYRAFQTVYVGLSPVVRGCLRRWVGDATLADDLLQDTFIRVHNARHRYRQGAPVGPWILTIARRLSIDALRKRSRNKEVPFKGDPEASPDLGPIEDRVETEELIAALHDAVADLPESLKVVVAMHKLEGKPLAEVAAILGIKEGAARVRAHRGYKRLRERMLGMFGRGENDQ